MCTLSILSYDLYLTSSKDDFIKSKLVFRFLILDLDFRDRISLVFKICQTFSITDFFLCVMEMNVDNQTLMTATSFIFTDPILSTHNHCSE